LLPDNWILPLSALFLLGLALEIPTLSLLSLSVGLIIAIASLWKKRVLYAVDYVRELHFSKGFPGEEIDIKVKVSNQKLLPIFWLTIGDLWPRAVAPMDESSLMESHLPGVARLVNIFRLAPFGQAELSYKVKLRKRGVYPLGPARLESGDPFGIYTESRKLESKDYLTVYPEIEEIPHIDFPSASPYGDRKVRKRLFEDVSRPMGIRDYQITDEFRRVHWPATARTGKMQTKVYQATAERVMAICLNTATSERHWEGVYPDLLEHLVRTAAAVVYQAHRDGFQIGLVSNGTMKNSDQPYRILPGRSNQQLSFLLTALAGVTPLVGLPFHRYLIRELPKLPYGTVMTVLTAVVDDLLLETLLVAKKHGRKIKLISVAEEAPPFLAGISTLHIPYVESKDEDKESS